MRLSVVYAFPTLTELACISHVMRFQPAAGMRCMRFMRYAFRALRVSYVMRFQFQPGIMRFMRYAFHALCVACVSCAMRFMRYAFHA